MPSFLQRRFQVRLLLGWVLLAGTAGCGPEDFAGPDGELAVSSPQAKEAAAITDPLSSATDRPARRPPSLRPRVEIETSQGTILLELDAARAPGTVRNFLDYVNSEFYDDTIVHYVEKESMILAGGYGTDKKPRTPRSPIRNEAHNGLKNVRGTIAMSRPMDLIDSATSQFFLNVRDNPLLDYQEDTAEGYGYCVFGRVIEGMDVVDRIAATPVRGENEPVTPVVIQHIRELTNAPTAARK